VLGRWPRATCAVVVSMLSATVGSLCLLGVSPAAIEWSTYLWEGQERDVGIYIPEDSPVTPRALVVLLHGGGGSAARTWEQEHGQSWRSLADRHGFALVLPEGSEDPGDPGSHHWNDCRFEVENAGVATAADDVGFILAVLDWSSEQASIDQARIFVAGASNGGMMTYRLSLEAGERFAAAAAMIANLPDPSECQPLVKPIPMLIMNGTDDPLMPFDGGCVAGSRCARGRVASTAETVGVWVESNGAKSDPLIRIAPNRVWSDGSWVIVYTYPAGENGCEVVYYEIRGGGHNVPGLEASSAARLAVAGPKNRDIDGTEEIWAFFQGVVLDP